MAVEKRLAPQASALTASLRSMGYTLETALADIIDNAITAKSTKVDIYCTFSSGQPLLCVIDNGDGMSEDEIIDALVIGGADPRDTRSKTDLGRFGLGLKTATFSQCRQLTVVSRSQGEIAAASWDLDLIEKRRDWIVSILDEGEIQSLDFVDQIPSSGTLVLWSKLDRVFEEVDPENRERFLNGKLSQLEDHLSLVFHRFLNGEVKNFPKLKISINGHDIGAFDPFCLKNKATQILPLEKVRLGDSVVEIQPYVLPHYSKLDANTRELYKNRSDFVSNQGAYVYRNGRLMAWGDWFRLIPKGEATKLARVKIDFTNDLDAMWTMDIKKASARPPAAVRDRLKQVIARVSEGSSRVSKGHGRKLFQKNQTPIWNRYAERGLIRYDINADHPMVLGLCESLSEQETKYLMMTLKAIGASLPSEMIYSDFSIDPKRLASSLNDEGTVLNEKLELLYEFSKSDGSVTQDGFKVLVRSTRLFDAHEDLVENFVKNKWEDS